MTLDHKIVDLINADLDREISAAAKRQLDIMLAGNNEARSFHAEMKLLCDAMETADDLEPPAHLHHLIMQTIETDRRIKAAPRRVLRIFAAPVLHLGAAFAAGVVLTLSIGDSDRIFQNVFDDVNGMVGTISDSGNRETVRAGTSIDISGVDGTIDVRESGRIPDRMLIVDFDLASTGPIDIVSSFSSQNVSFDGFAQMEGSDTNMMAEPGRITVRMEGRQRFALLLRDTGASDTSVDVRIVSSGTVVHEVRLSAGNEK